MTVRNPVLGLGPAGFQSNFEVYSEGAPVDVSRRIDVAHNTCLETVERARAPGPGAFLAILGRGFGRAPPSAWRRVATRWPQG